tara:strand:- start:593 stop:760 length:168 start_codon:yes stop_codon:yes gene_type:complete
MTELEQLKDELAKAYAKAYNNIPYWQWAAWLRVEDKEAGVERIKAKIEELKEQAE